MPTAIKLRVPGVQGGRFKSVTDLTVDYANAAALPDLIRYGGKVWQKSAGVNYAPFVFAPPVDIEQEGKIVEA